MGRASRPLILEFAPFLAKPAGPLGELTLPSLRLPYLVEVVSPKRLLTSETPILLPQPEERHCVCRCPVGKFR